MWSLILRDTNINSTTKEPMTAQGVIMSATEKYDILPPGDLIMLVAYINDFSSTLKCVIDTT